MKNVHRSVRYASVWILTCVILAILSSGWGFCPPGKPIFQTFYQPRFLVSDGYTTAAPNVDPNLVNPWGLAFGPGFAWVADNGPGLATLYDGKGTPQALVVEIPPGAPTGVVFNNTRSFSVTTRTLSSASVPATVTLTGCSRFIFATETGAIAAFVPEIMTTQTLTIVDRSSSGTVYKGIAIATRCFAKPKKTRDALYATDFHNGRIDVFDGQFNPITVPGGFRDSSIPAGYAPFGISNIGGFLFVTFAKQDDAKHDDVKGAGFGFVRMFTPDGVLVRRLISHTGLNAPWGLALASRDFGKFANHLLVGNFGDGTIGAYDLLNGRFDGKLRNADDRIITIDGLWAIVFGNGQPTQPRNTLFFTAGPNGENDGLFGTIDAVTVRVKPNPKPVAKPDKNKDKGKGKK